MGVVPTLVFVSALAAPQKANPGTWGPGKIAATTLARSVDSRLQNLSKVLLTYKFDYEKKVKGAATLQGGAAVLTPRQFRMIVPKIDLSKRIIIISESWLANGKQFGLSEDSPNPSPKPFSTRPKVPTNVINAWFSGFSRIIMSGVGQAEHPFEKLVASASKAGYKTTVNTRIVPFRGRNLVAHRFVLTKGPMRYEIVIDDRQRLPVNILNTIGQDSSRWSAVNWDLKPGKKLDPKAFQFAALGLAR